MIDKKISLGTILTGLTVIGTVIFTQGSYAATIETVQTEQVKTIKRVEKNEDSIVDLKIGQAKIETQLDDRFDRLEDLLFDLSD